MHSLKTLKLSIVSWILIFTSASASATVINHALTSTATASSSYLANTPNLAADGNTSTLWNSGGHTAWINFDLGSAKSISKITGLVIQNPSGATEHQIYLDNILSHTWSGITTNGDLLTWLLPTATTVQNIRIQTSSSPSWVAWAEVSIAEVPVPAPLVLMGLGILAIGITKKRKA